MKRASVCLLPCTPIVVTVRHTVVISQCHRCRCPDDGRMVVVMVVQTRRKNEQNQRQRLNRQVSVCLLALLQCSSSTYMARHLEGALLMTSHFHCSLRAGDSSSQQGNAPERHSEPVESASVHRTQECK